MALVDDIIRGHYAPRKPLEDQRDTIGNEVLTLADHNECVDIP